MERPILKPRRPNEDLDFHPMDTVDVGSSELSDEQVLEEIGASIDRPSAFGYKIGTIRSQLLNKDYTNASITIKAGLLATLVELVPIAEQGLRKSEATKGIYQFNALVSQMRELVADLDGERDLRGTVQQVVDDCVKPPMLLLSQAVVVFGSSLKQRIKHELKLDNKDEKALNLLIDDGLRDLARYVQSMSGEIQRRVDTKLEA